MLARLAFAIRQGPVAGALVFFLVLAVFGLYSTIAQYPASLSGCFGGTLTAHPLHCAYLEEAHNTGIIEIDAIYQGGLTLYVYLNQPQEFSTLAKLKMRALARKVISEHAAWDDCDILYDDYDGFGCQIGVLGGGLRSERGDFLPFVKPICLRNG